MKNDVVNSLDKITKIVETNKTNDNRYIDFIYSLATAYLECGEKKKAKQVIKLISQDDYHFLEKYDGDLEKVLNRISPELSSLSLVSKYLKTTINKTESNKVKDLAKIIYVSGQISANGISTLENHLKYVGKDIGNKEFLQSVMYLFMNYNDLQNYELLNVKFDLVNVSSKENSIGEAYYWTFWAHKPDQEKAKKLLESCKNKSFPSMPARWAGLYIPVIKVLEVRQIAVEAALKMNTNSSVYEESIKDNISKLAIKGGEMLNGKMVEYDYDTRIDALGDVAEILFETGRAEMASNALQALLGLVKKDKHLIVLCNSYSASL